MLDTDLTADDWAALVTQYKKRLQQHRGEPFPQDPHEQLWGAIGAVFRWWNKQRAITYRRLGATSPMLGHGRQRAVDGVRQYGRQFGDGCCVHAQSFDRRK